MDLGEDGSVTSIMPASEWNSITVNQINKGIVIVDNAITYTDGVQDFNEYVWVPIPESSNFARESWTTTESLTQQNLTEESTENAYWEDTTTAEYINMVSSIEQYKGFYIGRYEASNNGSNIAQSKRGVSAWTNVAQTTAITACTSNSTSNVHLIYGIEWDSTLKWLIGNAIISSSNTGETKEMDRNDIETNGSSWGNYSNSTGNATTNSGLKQNTGASEYWKANNIYDLSGNISEWTQETYSTTGTSKAYRGGCFMVEGNTDPVAARARYSESTALSFLRIPCWLLHNTRL